MLRLLAIFMIMSAFLLQPLSAKETLKVGVYNNGPKLFLTQNNKPQGFFIDLIDAIAKDANWNIQYVPCEWVECLRKVQYGEIDIMPDVAYSKERAEIYTFCDEVILPSWSMIYAKKGSITLLSLLDIHTKRLAVVKNSIQYEFLKEQARLFDIKPLFVEANSYQQTFEFVRDNKAELAVVNNFFGDFHEKAFGVQPTNISLDPIILKFAFPKTSPSYVKENIDRLMREYKQDKNSPYYQAREKWLDNKNQELLPAWLYWALGTICIVIIVLLCFIAFFKYLLNLKIKELKKNEKFLIAQSRSAAMGEMISMIAHQWKQPLAILSMISNNIKADIALGTFNVQSANSYHEQLSNQIFYLSHTIDDFKNYFKPNKEKQLVTDLSKIIDNSLNLLGKTLENNEIVLIKEYGNVKNISIYANELMQVIINLLKNANEAFAQSTESVKYIKIKTYIKKNSVYIEIEDNAGGIKEEILSKIFDPYFTTKDEFNGTGLGLYMSKSIIENHFGGKILVTCKENKSLFTIIFPLNAH